MKNIDLTYLYSLLCDCAVEDKIDWRSDPELSSNKKVMECINYIKNNFQIDLKKIFEEKAKKQKADDGNSYLGFFLFGVTHDVVTSVILDFSCLAPYYPQHGYGSVNDRVFNIYESFLEKYYKKITELKAEKAFEYIGENSKLNKYEMASLSTNDLIALQEKYIFAINQFMSGCSRHEGFVDYPFSLKSVFGERFCEKLNNLQEKIMLRKNLNAVLSEKFNEKGGE